MKKFVKGLLVSGFAVALLAGCSNKSKSSECPVCPPVPEPETKNAWTDEELEILDYYYHDEIPFACELSLEGVEDGVLYAVSKDEVSDEDLLAYDDMFQEDGHFKIYNVGPVTGGLSLDVGELGFDLSGDVFQYYRPYMDEAGYSLTRFYTIGLNEDGHLQVAMSASLTPLFSLSNGKIGTGGLYSMLFDDEGEEFNFLNEYYIWAANSNVSSQAGSPSYCDPFYYLTKYVFPDLLVKETDTATHYTLGSYDSLAAYAPFTSGNVLSEEFDSKFSITLMDFDVAGNKLSDFYTEDDFEGVLDWFDAFVDAGVFELLDSSYEVGEHGPEASMLVKDPDGFTSEFTVSFLTYGEGEDVETYLEFGYELVDFKLPSYGIYVADAILESINPNYSYSSLQVQTDSYSQRTVMGYIAYEATETYTMADAVEDAIDAIVENGIAKEYELEYLVPEEGELVIFASYLQDPIESTITVYCYPYVISGTNAIVTQVMVQERNALGTYYGADGQLLRDYYTAIMEWIYDDYSVYISQYTQPALADINAMAAMVNAGSLVGLDAAIAAGFENLDGINNLKSGGVGLLDYLFGFEIDETTGVVTWTGVYSEYVVGTAETFSQYEENFTPEDWETFNELYDAVKACEDNDPSSSDFYAKLVTSLYELFTFENTVTPWSDQAAAYLAEKWTFQESDYSAENWATIQAIYNAIPEQWSRSDFKQVVDGAVALANAVPTKLQEYKSAKLTALETLFNGYNQEDYYEEGWAELTAAYADGQTAINAATSEAEVDTAYGACKDAMDAVPTKAEVDTYRTSRLDDLEIAFHGYADSYEEQSSTYQAIKAAYDAGVAAINAANTISAIDAEYEACDNAMHSIK